MTVDEYGVGDCPGVVRFSPAPPDGFPQCYYGTPQIPVIPPIPVCQPGHCIPDHPPPPPTHTVPEPSTFALLFVAVVVLLWVQRRAL
jgi:hypothetical protein